MADTSKRIVYNNEFGTITVLIPSSNCQRTIEDIAAKDVPQGRKYKIVDAADIPTDKSFRNAWTVDESDLTDGVGDERGEV